MLINNLYNRKTNDHKIKIKELSRNMLNSQKNQHNVSPSEYSKKIFKTLMQIGKK